jgi:hypothetical protein
MKAEKRTIIAIAVLTASILVLVSTKQLTIAASGKRGSVDAAVQLVKSWYRRRLMSPPSRILVQIVDSNRWDVFAGPPAIERYFLVDPVTMSIVRTDQ